MYKLQKVPGAHALEAFSDFYIYVEFKCWAEKRGWR